jgi:hypothetical protein
MHSPEKARSVVIILDEARAYDREGCAPKLVDVHLRGTPDAVDHRLHIRRRAGKVAQALCLEPSTI